MDAERLDRLRERLSRSGGLFGAASRQAAVKELAKDGSPEAVTLLANVVVDAPDEKTRALANQALDEIENADSINLICELWAGTRNYDLGQLIARKGWVARAPVELRVLTALKSGRWEAVQRDGVATVMPLVTACADQEPEVVGNAQAAIRQLADPAMREEVCRILIDADHPAAEEAAVAGGYGPEDVHQRALYLFLTGQWPAYEALDAGNVLLKTVYRDAREALKLRVMARALKAGRVDWVMNVALGEDLGLVSENEWETSLAILKATGRWPELWRLARDGPPKWAARIILRIKQAGWEPGPDPERAHLRELSALAPDAGVFSLNLGRFVQRIGLPYGNSGHVHCIALGQDSKLLASGCDDNTIRLWRVPAKEPLKTLKEHKGGVMALALGPGSALLASGSNDNTVRLWSLPEGEPRAVLRGHKAWVLALRISPDGTTLTSADAEGTVRIWKLPVGEPLEVLERRTGRISALAISPDAKLVAGGGEEGAVRLWQPSDTEWHKTLDGHSGQVLTLAVSPDGRLLGSGSDEGTAKLWRLPDGKPLQDLKGRHLGGVTSLAVSPDGKTLATGSWDRTIRLWRVVDGEPMATLEGHSKEITTLAISPDGLTLASGSADRTVRLWDLRPVRLANLPVCQLTREDLAWTQEALAGEDLSQVERRWLEFISALMKER